MAFPIVSFVCVYNDAELLGRRLAPSVALQQGPHELILVDNRLGRFANAASALNWGARQAKGELLVFAHQDVELLSDAWASRLCDFADSWQWGWAGLVGATGDGVHVGFVRDRAALLGAPFAAPVPVQTIDECVLIHRRVANGQPYFDEGIPGWHAYGVDACCTAGRNGESNVVLPLPVWHDSPARNRQGLADALDYVWNKHGGAVGRIHTVSGNRPAAGWWTHQAGQLRRRALRAWFTLQRFDDAYTAWLPEMLERLTADEAAVDCLHAKFWLDAIDASSFVAGKPGTRSVRHLFAGWDRPVDAPCVVVGADLAADPRDVLDGLRACAPMAKRRIVCASLRTGRDLSAWKALRARAIYAGLAPGPGGHALVLELGERT